nr:MAG TPA: hypothetical protein [Caudoviricetes sp.]
MLNGQNKQTDLFSTTSGGLYSQALKNRKAFVNSLNLWTCF